MAFPTWDPATVAAVTLSGGNLVATSTGTTSTNQGARVANADAKTSGKFYFEVTNTAHFIGANQAIGVGTIASTYTSLGNSATTGVMCYFVGGNIWTNNVNTGNSLGIQITGNVWGIAVDFDNRRIWFRLLPSGNWNGSGTANPATNTGGVTIPAGTMVPFLTFGGGGGVANSIKTANFGASAFIGAVPVGFNAGWDVIVVTPPPPANNYAGGEGRRIRKYSRKRKREELEKFLAIVSDAPPPDEAPAPAPPPAPAVLPALPSVPAPVLVKGPPAPGLMAGVPIPPITVLRSPPVENEDEIEIALLLELLS